LSVERFTPIFTTYYQACRSKLNGEQLRDLDEKIECLLLDPAPPLIKPLVGRLRGKYSIKFAGNPYRPSHRLIVAINLNSRIIHFLYLAPRKVVYERNLQMWS
jgi:mRNA-degrading endonuclease RelE of RelBE toxin-antitoxin system